jgi:hypothetical protein
MTETPHDTLALTVAPPLISEFFPLFQQGVRVPCRTECTLGDLLSGQWGINPDYVKDRITTIFLNHRAIDSIATTRVEGGSTLALSGAMPGLVGATMRCGGHLAAMRGAMTHQQEETPKAGNGTWIRLKLFNLLLPELGPGFLERGILMDGNELQHFLQERPEAFWQTVSGTVPHGSAGDRESILAGAARWEGRDFLLTVVLKG